MAKQPPASQDVISANTFNQEDNPDAIKGVQANESFLLTAKPGEALGQLGETKGFAKYQFDGEAYDNIVAQVEALGEIQSTLSRNFAAISDAEQQISNAQIELSKLPQEGRTEEQQQSFEEHTNTIESQTRRMDRNLDEGNRALKATAKQLGQNVDAVPTIGKNDTAGAITALQKGVADLQPKIEALAPQQSAMNKVAGPAGYLMGEGNPPPTPDRGLLTRSVASHKVDELLKTNVVAEERLATDKNGRTMGVSIQGNGAGVTGDYANPGEEKKACFLNVDYSNPEIQKGLSDLEVNDYITGQIDRHAGNIYIDPETNKVTGIDNDLAFPEISREEMFEVGGDFTGKAVDGMPSVIHQDTANKILATDPEELRKTLEQIPAPDGVGKMGPGAINGAVKRLENLQNAIKSGDPSVQVVKKFDDATYNAALQKQEKHIQDHPRFEADDVTVNREKSVKAAAPTSYLGAVMKAKETYSIGQAVEPDKFGVRESGPKASRDPAIVTAKAMEMKQDLDGLKDQLKQQQSQLQKLKSGGIGGMFSKLRGGDEQKISAKIEGTIKAIDNTEAKLDNLLSKLPKEDRQKLGAQVGRPDPIKPPVPKVDTPKVDTPKVDAPKVDAPKVDAPKVDQPAVKQPFQKPEVPKLDLKGIRKDDPVEEKVGKEETKALRETTRDKLKNIRKERAETDKGLDVDPTSTRANVKVATTTDTGTNTKKSQTLN